MVQPSKFREGFDAFQHRFDFAQLDAEAADFHLAIHPPPVLQVAIRIPCREVAGAIGRSFIRKLDEARGGFLGPLEIAPRQGGTEDMDLSRNAGRAEAARAVENQNLAVGHRTADASFRPAVDVGRRSGIDRRFGGAVEVEEAAVRRPLGGQVRGTDIAADDDAVEIGHGGRFEKL